MQNSKDHQKMKSERKSSNVYVVTRDGRRVESLNYFSEAAAKDRANVLKKMLKYWRDSDLSKVEVIHTERPHKIW